MLFYCGALFSHRCRPLIPPFVPFLREYTPVLMALKHLANGADPNSLGIRLRLTPYVLQVGNNCETTFPRD